MKKVKNIRVKEDLDNNFHTLYNGIYLSKNEIKVLNINGFDYKNYKNINELMFDIEEYLIDNYNEDLDVVLESIATFNYYHNTNK